MEGEDEPLVPRGKYRSEGAAAAVAAAAAKSATEWAFLSQRLLERESEMAVRCRNGRGRSVTFAGNKEDGHDEREVKIRDVGEYRDEEELRLQMPTAGWP